MKITTAQQSVIPFRHYSYPDSQQQVIIDSQTWEQEKGGLLQVVFENGKIVKETTLSEIRKRVRG